VGAPAKSLSVTSGLRRRRRCQRERWLGAPWPERVKVSALRRAAGPSSGVAGCGRALLLAVLLSAGLVVQRLLGVRCWRVGFGGWKLCLQLLKVSDAVTVR